MAPSSPVFTSSHPPTLEEYLPLELEDKLFQEEDSDVGHLHLSRSHFYTTYQEDTFE